jgi:hypothetical protein
MFSTAPPAYNSFAVIIYNEVTIAHCHVPSSWLDEQLLMSGRDPHCDLETSDDWLLVRYLRFFGAIATVA